MKTILAVGYDPDHLDLSDPGLPPNLTADKIRDGVERGIKQLRERGYDAEHCAIRPDGDAAGVVERQLATRTYDLVNIGAGVRLASKHLDVFEAVMNTIHSGAPRAKIAFNSGLDDLPQSAERLLG